MLTRKTIKDLRWLAQEFGTKEEQEELEQRLAEKQAEEDLQLIQKYEQTTQNPS